MLYSITSTAKPNIHILGAGALGCIYGAQLAEAGCDVTLIARNTAHVEALNTHGLTLEFPKIHNAPPSKLITKLTAVHHIREATTKPDLILLLVKGPDTVNSMVSAAPFIPSACTVLSLQNGLGNSDVMEQIIPARQVLTGISYNGGTLLGPGKVLFGGSGKTIIGEANGNDTPRINALKALFDRAHLPCIATRNILGLAWAKLVVNAGINPVAAITKLTNAQIAEDQNALDLMKALVAEALQVAEKIGVELELKNPMQHVISIAKATGNNKASMLQDILAKRKTEIDNINGIIVKKGQELQVATPVNTAITNIIKALENNS